MCAASEISLALRETQSRGDALLKAVSDIKAGFASNPQPWEQTFDRMAQSGMQAVTINSEGLAFQHKGFIAKLAVARRLPLSVWSRETLQAGALSATCPNQRGQIDAERGMRRREFMGLRNCQPKAFHHE
jgi:hypothetical protein